MLTRREFGYDAADATAIVQKALDAGAEKVVIDAAKGPWTVGPVFARSDTVIEFEEGAVLLAKPGEFLPRRAALFNLLTVTNVTLRGLGAGATIRMRRDDYFKPPYVSAEWRHTLNVMSSKNVTIENLTMADSGGDGMYFGVSRRGFPNENIVVRKNPKSEDKVAIVTLGGSGHEPALSGFVGDGMLDCSVVGDVFAAPGAQRLFQALQLMKREAGILLVVLNHSGDVMSANMACQLAERAGIKVRKVNISVEGIRV